MLRRLSLNSPEKPGSLSPKLFIRVKTGELTFEILNCIPVGIIVLENCEIIGCNITFTKYSGYSHQAIQGMLINDLVPKYAIGEIASKNVADLKEITDSISRRENKMIKKFNVYTSKEQVNNSDLIIRHEGRFCMITFSQFNDLFTD